MDTFSLISLISLFIIAVLVLIESQLMVGQDQAKIWIKN